MMQAMRVTHDLNYLTKMFHNPSGRGFEMKRFAVVSLLGACCIANTAQAASLDASMNVTALVTAACSKLTSGNLDFGSNGAADTDTNKSVDITVKCDMGTGYTVELDYGQNPLSTQRQVADSSLGEFMDYDIFQPGGTTPWGTLANSAAVARTGNGADQVLTAPAVLHRNSGANAGSYTDLVTVTLNF
jgi:spore coat protein U-like protein